LGRTFTVIFTLFFLTTFWIRYERLFQRSLVEPVEWPDTTEEYVIDLNRPESGKVDLSEESQKPPKRSISNVLIPNRIGLDELTQLLYNEGILADTLEFKWISETHGWRSFQKGFYEFQHDEPIHVSLNRMGLGLQSPIPVTILPGMTVSSLSALLGRQLEADSIDFDHLLRSSIGTEVKDNTGLKKGTSFTFKPESRFSKMLPETYFMFWNTTPEKVIERVESEFTSRIQQLRKSVSESVSHLTDQELIVLASIVEWEAKFDDEMKTISGLYHNRLKRGMKLQADPTVNFAIGERRRLRYRDYQYEHPYNTYVIKGLPPGPITNPSLSSLEAAYQPEVHEYLFMVATPEGRHEFNRRYEDHLVAAERWQSWIEEQVRIRRSMEREALER